MKTYQIWQNFEAQAPEAVNFHEENLGQTPSSNYETPAKNFDITLNTGLLILPFIGTLILFGSLKFLNKSREEKNITASNYMFQRSQQIPCANCQYFNNNPYLKCAVNPHDALTEKALSCTEYKPGETNEPLA